MTYRDVAQLGSALRSGRRGRRFESCHPDFFFLGLTRGPVFKSPMAHHIIHKFKKQPEMAVFFVYIDMPQKEIL